MAFSRYTRDNLTSDAAGLEKAGAISALRSAIKNNQIGILQRLVVTQSDRLDTLAGAFYGDGRYWWVLAAASNIGWGLQVPPGTIVLVPDLKDVERLIA
jgi:nucleoid-associated protein YgaU